jgi:hypothetical protein
VTRTAHQWPNPRTGVFHRRDGKHPWKLLLHVGKHELARRVMIDLVGRGPSGDYTVAPADRPPARFR